MFASESKSEPFAFGTISVGHKIPSKYDGEDHWIVTKVSPSRKQVTVWSKPPENYGGYKTRKRSFQFRWDGTGYKRQGRYLRPDGIK